MPPGNSCRRAHRLVGRDPVRASALAPAASNPYYWQPGSIYKLDR